jgi:hypothetical protein
MAQPSGPPDTADGKSWDGMASSPDRTAGLVVRDYQPEDARALCTLIDADKLPGQPPCTTASLVPPPPDPVTMAG